MRGCEETMEFQLGIGSQVFKEKPNKTISYQEHSDYLSRLRCFCFDSSADDGERNYKQHQSFKEAGKQIGVHPQKCIYVRIYMKNAKIIEQGEYRIS